MSDTSGAKQSPKAYAEETLGVHKVHDDANKAHGRLGAALDIYAEQSKRIRQAHDETEQREYELASELRASDPSISQEALKRALREHHRTDENLVQMRRVLHDAQGKQEAAHADIEREKYRLRVLTARMNELGGLLTFYASVRMPRPAEPQ